MQESAIFKQEDYMTGRSICLLLFCGLSLLLPATGWPHLPHDTSEYGTGLNFLLNRNASRTPGNCSGIYCHHSGDGSSGNGSSMEAGLQEISTDCLHCHRHDAASEHASTSDGRNHGKHVDPVTAAKMACYTCHAPFSSR